MRHLILPYPVKYLFYAWLIIQKITQHIRRLRTITFIMFILKISNEMIIYHKSKLCVCVSVFKENNYIEGYFPFFFFIVCVCSPFHRSKGNILNYSCFYLVYTNNNKIKHKLSHTNTVCCSYLLKSVEKSIFGLNFSCVLVQNQCQQK